MERNDYADEVLAKANLKLNSNRDGLIHASTVWKGDFTTVIYNLPCGEIEEVWHPRFLSEGELCFLSSLIDPKEEF
jgi:hypothetical protein